MAKSVLVVDDDRYVLRLLSYILEGDGYQVWTAGSGEEALALMSQSPPDLIICDLLMPKLDGFTLIEQIRAHPQFRALPILILTARGQEKDFRRARQVGANDYLTKPFSSAQVLLGVRQQIGK